jgi:hypothetical protein
MMSQEGGREEKEHFRRTFGNAFWISGTRILEHLEIAFQEHRLELLLLRPHFESIVWSYFTSQV